MKTNIFSGKLTSIFLALLTCALWGSLYPCIKVGYEAFCISSSDIPSVIVFAGLRFALSGVLLVGADSVKEKKLSLPDKKGFMSIFWIMIMSIVLHYSFTYIALSVGEGSKSAIIKQVGFLFLSCFAFIFDKSDKFTIPKLISGLLGFAGIIVTNMDSSGFTFGFGDFLLILSSMCACISTVLTKAATKIVKPVHIVAYSQLMGGILMLIAGFAMGGNLPVINSGSVLIFSYICLSSIAAYVLWNILVKYNDLSKLSVIKFSEPLFAVIFSGMILGEKILRPSYIAAFVIIFVAIVVGNGVKKNEG